MQDFFPQQYDYDFIPVQHWLFITNTSLLINGSSLIEKYPIKICGSVQKFIAMPHFYELIALQRCQFNEISCNYNSTPKPSEFPRLKPPALKNRKNPSDSVETTASAVPATSPWHSADGPKKHRRDGAAGAAAYTTRGRWWRKSSARAHAASPQTCPDAS